MKHPLLGTHQTKEHIAKRIASYKSHPRKLQDMETKFLKKIKKHKNGCWVWIGAMFNPKKPTGGYGQMRVGRVGEQKLVQAHRISYELYIGKKPEKLEIDHLCKNTLCVNPKHLEAVTHYENMKRGKLGEIRNFK